MFSPAGAESTSTNGKKLYVRFIENQAQKTLENSDSEWVRL